MAICRSTSSECQYFKESGHDSMAASGSATLPVVRLQVTAGSLSLCLVAQRFKDLGFGSV